MAESIVYGMAGNILSTLTSHVVQKIGLVIGVKEELKKLERTLSTINNVLKDADEQQLINNNELKGWVKNIMAACYEAEDVLDEFATEDLLRQLKTRDSHFKSVRGSAYSIRAISFRLKMGRMIKEISLKFDEIANDRSKFHLPTKVVDIKVLNREREYTHSFVDEPEVFGRNDDKEKIINLLSTSDEESVIGIIGMGGLGKTTLAQLVYNDKGVDQVFEKKMWVGVYQEFDVKKILRNIIKSATSNECPDLEMDQLRSLFQELVKGKKFLLVLDDVWNEDSGKWDKLKFVTSSGAHGSKVVVTTRSRKVASAMEAEMYILEGLSRDDCWKVFKHKAFLKGEEQADPNLVVIGKEMVKRCHGVPLAAKTLGSLMRMKTTEREWEDVRDNGLWMQSQNENDIMPAIRLSYNHLPIYLKQCFAYFAASQIDVNYEKHEVIQSWIAHGFVRLSPGDSRSLEDVGNEYVKELLWRSLIYQPVQDSCGNLISFKVHALVHNLARDVGGTEYIHFEEGKQVTNSKEIRYAEFYQCSSSEILIALGQMPNLRGLGLKTFPGNDVFSRLQCLRCLMMVDCPSDIGELKHLRKLFLSGVQTLPKSITKLVNLQTFDLSCCPKLRELPKKIGKLVNLRHVYVAENAPLSYMPSGFKYLTSLRTLAVFFVGKGVGCKLNELHALIHLEGQLVIKNLENVRDARECAEVNLKEKQRLQRLKFSWNNQDYGEDVRREGDRDVLETLQPHSDLQILQIEGYGSSMFASWMMKSFFPKLVEVSVVNCRNVKNLPPLGELPLLRVLFLKDMEALEFIEGRVETWFTGWFPSLKILRLENLFSLESIGLKEVPGALSSLPSLLELIIIGCPRLEIMPLLPSLERLEVSCCGRELVQALLMPPVEIATTSSLKGLKYMKVQKCRDLVRLPKNWLRFLVSLEELVVQDCKRLVSLDDEETQGCPDGMEYLSSLNLTSLEILELPSLEIVPQWIQNLTKLQKLCIEDCPRLIDVPIDMQNLTALEVLVIGLCNSLRSWPNGLGSLVSLKELGIGCSRGVPYLPEELQQLTGLRVLIISECYTMLTLPKWLLNFTSLERFTINGLENLINIPEWFPNLTTIQQLYISECGELTSRCQKEAGVDWPKIAHISNIELDGELIQGS